MGQIGVLHFLWYAFPDRIFHVFTGFFKGIDHAIPFQEIVIGDPETTARPGSGTAKEFCLFDDEHIQPQGFCDQGCGHAAAAGTNHQ